MSVSHLAGPPLAEVVARARAEAKAAGELVGAATGPFESTIPVEARPLVRAWLTDGGYDAALAEVVAADPDLATE